MSSWSRRCERERRLAHTYLSIKQLVLDAGYDREIAWQETAADLPITERRFLHESAWVVLSAGLSEKVVRRVFRPLVDAFDGMDSAAKTLEVASAGGREAALGVFGHQGKVDAIIGIARYVAEEGMTIVRERLFAEGTAFLQELPYIGPITSCHLGKNLGLPLAKADRHLSRIASTLGFADAQTLCTEIYRLLGEPVEVADLVLWRHATLDPAYLDHHRAAYSVSDESEDADGSAGRVALGLAHASEE